MIVSIFNMLELSSNNDSAASRNFYREHSGIAYSTIRIFQKQDQYFTLLNTMIISDVRSISLDQQIIYQNDMNKTWLHSDLSELDVVESL